MIILGIEAAAKNAGAALMEDQRLVAEVFVSGRLTHSETLMPMIHEVLERSGKTLEEVDYLALTAGPGSFTGLRIGAATVKGLSLALKKPVVPLSTLEACAYTGSFPGEEQYYRAAIMDARRSQVYAAVYLGKKEVLPEGTYPLEEVAAYLKNALTDNKAALFFGDAVSLYREQLKRELGEKYLEAPAHIRELKASKNCALAGEKLEELGEKAARSGKELEIRYLRKPQAEREREERARNAAKEESIRCLELSHAAKMLEIEEKSFEDPWTIGMIEAELSAKQAVYVGYFEKEQLLGYAGCWQVLDEGHIMNVAVIPSRRGEGIGRRLLETLFEEGAGRGILYWTLEVRESNKAARSLYEKLGFELAGIRPDYYAEPRENAAIYWKGKSHESNDLQ